MKSVSLCFYGGCGGYGFSNGLLMLTSMKGSIKKKNEDEMKCKNSGSRIRENRVALAPKEAFYTHTHTCHQEMFCFWSLIQMVLVWDSCENQIHNPAEKLG